MGGATVAFHLLHAEDVSTAWSPTIMLATCLTACGLIVTALQDGMFSRLLGTRVLVFLGEISFSIYLLHEFISLWVIRHAGLPRPVEAWIVLALVVALAWLSYRLIERPGIKLGYRLGNRLQRASLK
jgi:peptidoglycan/LPS O-acetylase OafA/YrhL